VTVAVSTGGASPALSRWLRNRIAASLPARLETVAALLDEAREELRATGAATDSVDWAHLLDHTVVPLVDADRIDEARAAIRRVLGTGDDGAAGGQADHPGEGPAGGPVGKVRG
jgi:siroheme synthase (precorrin-2 oxidase/ferrochelatase)